MANTVTLLSYANTFADWVITTNALARENNDFAANNFVKPSGTLYLNDTSLGLQVANNAIFGGQFQVQGTGSSGYVQNNLRVDGQLVLQNTTTSVQASGVVFANGSGNGLVVANNASVTGNVHVLNNGVVARTFTANAINANTVVTSPILNSTGTVFGEVITANTAVNAPTVSVSTALNVGGTTRTTTLIHTHTPTYTHRSIHTHTSANLLLDGIQEGHVVFLSFDGVGKENVCLVGNQVFNGHLLHTL